MEEIFKQMLLQLFKNPEFRAELAKVQAESMREMGFQPNITCITGLNAIGEYLGVSGKWLNENQGWRKYSQQIGNKIFFYPQLMVADIQKGVNIAA